MGVAPFKFKLEIINTLRKSVKLCNKRLNLRRAEEGKKKLLVDWQGLLQAACEPVNDLASILGVY